MRYPPAVHVISKKALLDFIKRHPDSGPPLLAWHRLMEKSTFQGFGGLRAAVPTVDRVGTLYVFNIGGNKYRLIASIHFNRRKVYVRHVFTHAEYDRGGWKK